MKFLVDMPLSPALADWLVDHGHDAVHASNIVWLLLLCPMKYFDACWPRVSGRGSGRPRFSTMAEADGPGLILFRAGDWNEEEAVARLETTLNAVPENELLTSIVVIERTKIRRRRLPVK
jgi:hypothetical protein